MLFVLYVRRSAQIFLIWIEKGSPKKISYERHAYESVDEKTPILCYVPKTTKKEFMHLRVKEKENLLIYLNP